MAESRVPRHFVTKSQPMRHSREGGNPESERVPKPDWIPACAGMTKVGQVQAGVSG